MPFYRVVTNLREYTKYAVNEEEARKKAIVQLNSTKHEVIYELFEVES